MPEKRVNLAVIIHAQRVVGKERKRSDTPFDLAEHSTLLGSLKLAKKALSVTTQLAGF